VKQTKGVARDEAKAEGSEGAAWGVEHCHLPHDCHAVPCGKKNNMQRAAFT